MHIELGNTHIGYHIGHIDVAFSSTWQTERILEEAPGDSLSNKPGRCCSKDFPISIFQSSDGTNEAPGLNNGNHRPNVGVWAISASGLFSARRRRSTASPKVLSGFSHSINQDIILADGIFPQTQGHASKTLVGLL